MMNVCFKRRMIYCALSLSNCLAVACLAAEPSSSPSTVAATKQAQELVTSALQAEGEGDFLARQRLLQSAEACAADCPELKWQQGLVRIDDQWLSIDSCVDKAADNKLLAEYESRRAQLIDAPQNHLAMAEWCVSQQLLPQARAHYERVIQTDSDHVVARVALGYQLVSGEWISPQQIAVWGARGEATRASLATYGEQLQQIARDLSQANREKQLAARKSLMELQQNDCIPAAESVFRNASDDISLVVVEWLSARDCVAGSLALLNYAVQHTSPTIRESATHALKDRPLHDFVPQLLTMLSSPVFSMAVPSFNRNGSLAGYQQAFAQEESDRTQVFAISTQVTRTQPLLRSSAFSVDAAPLSLQMSRAAERQADDLIERNAREWAELETRARAALSQQRNEGIAFQNGRVMQILSQIANREFSSDPRVAWQWWDELNETGYQRSKPLRYREQRQGLTLASYQPPRPACECFVAGTPVLTTRGLKSIESIVAGDTVFSRDVLSGALLVKPVLQATQRPAEPTFEVVVGSDQLRCTRGHLFWVSGSGWKKASELVAGDVLHAAGEPTVVTSVKPSPSQVTYNLQVADCNTFFVGRSRVLSHDVTQRQATDQTVPGLTH